MFKKIDLKIKYNIILYKMPKTFSLKEFPNPLYINDIANHPDIYEQQVEALEAYCSKFDYTDGSITTEYVKSTAYGRYFVKNPTVLSSTIMWNKIRATLFSEGDYDIDIVNCHSELLLTLLKNNTNYDITNLEHYCSNRAEVIDAITIETSAINHYNTYNKDNKIKKDIVKSLFTIVLYGGTIDTWETEFGFNSKDYKLTPFVKDYIEEIQMNTNIIINDKRFKDIVDSIKSLKIKEAKDKFKKKFNIEKFKLNSGALLSVILQEYETLIIEEAMQVMESHGATITSYNYDGFQIRKVDDVDELVHTLNFYINRAAISHNRAIKPFVFDNIKFIVKPFREGLDVEVVVLDSINFETKIITKTKSFMVQKKYFEKFHAKIENPFCYIRDDENGIMFIKPKDLTQLYFNIYCKIGKEDEQFIHHWIMEKDIKTFYTYNFYPNIDMCPKNCFNLWKPFPILKTPLDPKVDTSKIYEFMKMLLRECDEYVLNWLAHIVQFPARKTEICILLFGSQGCGKSTVGEYMLRKIIGIDKMIITSKIEKMFGKFVNTQGKLLAVLNEASGKDTFNICDILKDAITCSTTEQEKKGIDAVTITDYTNYIFTTNNINSVKIPEDDRRFMPIEVNEQHKNDKAYFKVLYDILDNDIIMRKFYEELMERDLSEFNLVIDRPETELMKDMRSMNRNCIKQFIIYWKEKVMTNMDEDGNFMEKKMSGAKLYECFNHFWTIEGKKTESKPTSTKFGIELKQFKDHVITHNRSGNGMSYEIILA
jgi:hypothetical protein